MIHLTATFHAQSGKEQQLKEVLTQALEPTRNEDSFFTHLSTQGPTRGVIWLP